MNRHSISFLSFCFTLTLCNFNCSFIQKQIAIDDCLDHGGSWNYELSQCDTSDQYSYFKPDTVPSLAQRALLVQESSKRLLNSSESNKHKKQVEFVNVFPSSFEDMNRLFGYDERNGPGPLYEQGNIIEQFSNLDLSNSKIYFQKYVDICVNGKWHADNIREGFGISNKILSHTEHILPELMKRNDADLKSIFLFVYDGPHPDNDFNKDLYNGLMNKIPNEYERVKKLMTYSYEQLLNEEHGH